jgi:hypothetical protein
MTRTMNAVTHGHYIGGRPSPTYNSWRAMVERCTREQHPRYPHYGGRGIEVDKRWRGRGGFTRFLEDVGTRPEGKTLDRINVNGHYTPGNVRWATPTEQRWNRRDFSARVDDAPEDWQVAPLYPALDLAPVGTDLWPF